MHRRHTCIYTHNQTCVHIRLLRLLSDSFLQQLLQYTRRPKKRLGSRSSTQTTHACHALLQSHVSSSERCGAFFTFWGSCTIPFLPLLYTDYTALYTYICYTVYEVQKRHACYTICIDTKHIYIYVLYNFVHVVEAHLLCAYRCTCIHTTAYRKKTASVPLCAVVPPSQAELLLQQGVHAGQPSAGVLHHAVRQTEFISTTTAASNGRKGLEGRPHQ